MHREDEVLHRGGGLADDALVGAGADMRGADDVRQFEERVIGSRRLFVEDVGAVAADLSGLEGSDHVGCVDNFAAGAVEDEDALFHLRETFRAHQVAGLRREIRVERDVVGGGVDFVEVGGPFDVVRSGELFVPINVVRDDAHAESASADGDFFADAAEADDADGFFEELVTGLAFPRVRTGGVGVEKKILLEREQEEEGMFSDSGVVDAGSEEERDAELGARLHVDLVDTDAVFGKDLQFRERLLEDLAGDEIVAADVAVDITDEGEGVGLVEGAAGADDLPAGVGEELVVLARRVLERGRREEDFSHESGRNKERGSHTSLRKVKQKVRHVVRRLARSERCVHCVRFDDVVHHHHGVAQTQARRPRRAHR